MEVIGYQGGFAKVKLDDNELTQMSRLVDMISDSRTQEMIHIRNHPPGDDSVKVEFAGLMKRLFPHILVVERPPNSYPVREFCPNVYKDMQDERAIAIGSKFLLGEDYSKFNGELQVVEEDSRKGIYFVTVEVGSRWKRRPVDDVVEMLAKSERLSGIRPITGIDQSSQRYGISGVLQFDKILEFYDLARQAVIQSKEILGVLGIRGVQDLTVLLRDKNEHENAVIRRESGFLYTEALHVLFEYAGKSL
tara:strand:+ start:2221 stop:2967 length:747 start_codon:yes stop_codon:yes gene_type:complete